MARQISKIQIRRGTAAAWALENPILSSGEMGLDINSKQFKIGDGVTPWATLPAVEQRSTAWSAQIVLAEEFGVRSWAHTDPEPTQALALANAVSLQAAIDACAGTKILFLPEGVIWVARYHVRKSNSVVFGVDRAGGTVIKMHGSVHRDMPLSVSSTRGTARSAIQWSNITFDFNRTRWSRGANEAGTAVQDNDSQVATYGASGVIAFTTFDRESVFGADSDAMTGTAFIASDVNPFGSGKRSLYSAIRAIDGYKHSLDVTAPSYGRGLGRLDGPRHYDPQPACGIDIVRPYVVGAGDDNGTMHHCYDVNIWDGFSDVTSGVRTGNSNCWEIDEGCRLVSFFGKTVAFGSGSGMEIKAHEDSPAPFGIYIQHLIAVNNCAGMNIRHLGHHSDEVAVTYLITAVNQGTATLTISTSEINEPLGDLLSAGDTFSIVDSTGNDGLYMVASATYVASTGVTTLRIVTDTSAIDPEDLPAGLLTALASAVADGGIEVPTPLASPTAENVHVEKLTVVAPRRTTTADDARIIFRQAATLTGVKNAAYRGIRWGDVEILDGLPPSDDLENLQLPWRATGISSGGYLFRAYLRASNINIERLKIRGFPGADQGLYASGSFRGDLRIGWFDSEDGPKTPLYATTDVANVTIGGYRIRRDSAAHGLGDYGVRLSGVDSTKSLGPGSITGYTVPVRYANEDFSEPPAAFAQPVLTQRYFHAFTYFNGAGSGANEVSQPGVRLSIKEPTSLDLGTGGGRSILWDFLPSGGSWQEYAELRSAKANASDSNYAFDIHLDLSPDGTTANKRPVLTAKAETGIVDFPLGATVQGGRGVLGRGRATVQHKYTASYGGIYYDVITVTGGPHTVVKKFGPDADSLGVQLRRTARNMAEISGYPIVLNADRASAPDGNDWTTSLSAINRGLQIVDGVAYRDFQVGTSQDKAFVMMKDGSHSTAFISDGKTAAQWVAEGALWTVGGFAFLRINSETIDVSADASIADISARTIFGRMPNGDFKILVVEGETGVYGIGGQNMADLCEDEGMDIAICCDGGGSSQCWWGDAYAHPSSDTTDTVSANPQDAGRRVCGFLCIDVDSVIDYNSGIVALTTPADLTPSNTDYPALYLRQIGGNVHLYANIVPTTALPANADKTLTSVALRPRYFSIGAVALRGNLQALTSGGYAWPVPVIASGSGVLTLRPGTAAIPGPATVTGVHGNYSWRARWAR